MLLLQVVSVVSAEDVLLTWEEDRSQRSLGELARNKIVGPKSTCLCSSKVSIDITIEVGNITRPEKKRERNIGNVKETEKMAIENKSVRKKKQVGK